MSDWQPIDTAPKDGTEFLAFREDAGVFMARWDCAASFMTDHEINLLSEDSDWIDEPDWFAADFVSGCRLDGDLIPTHWMPLPSPPEPDHD